jgi:hypothetical protein
MSAVVAGKRSRSRAIDTDARGHAQGDGPARVFLLSPANCSGKRARMLLRQQAVFPLAGRLRAGGAPIGEIFTFVSGLYFRGKMAYATAFGRSRGGAEGVYVITSDRGLVDPGLVIGPADIEAFATQEIDAANPGYRAPLEHSAVALRESIGDGSVVLLGSVASGKYADVLLDVFGERLLFPEAFVGRGDMSRGGLMLRCAEDGLELDYVPLEGAVRRGSRPPRLTPRK